MAAKTEPTEGIKCPKCNKFVTEVLKTVRHDSTLIRVRRCLTKRCRYIFNTTESADK